MNNIKPNLKKNKNHAKLYINSQRNLVTKKLNGHNYSKLIEAIYCSNHKWSQLFQALTKRSIQFQIWRKARIQQLRNYEQKTNYNPEFNNTELYSTTSENQNFFHQKIASNPTNSTKNK